VNPPDHKPQRSIGDVLTNSQQQLAACSDSPRLDAEVLLAKVLGVSRAQLFARPESPVSEQDDERFKQLLARRLNGEPIAHILGHREFWSLQLDVTPATLIPRPETELLVELALERIPVSAMLDIADMGTGSGAIALAVASERPHCRIVASDTSEEALAVARRNAMQLGLTNIEFLQGDWYQALGAAHFDVILSNPPYIRSDDPHLAQGDVRFDPHAALVSGVEGLDALRCIVGNAAQHLRPGGWLLVEHGYDQEEAVAGLFVAAGFTEIATVNDLGGLPRVSFGRYQTKIGANINPQ
jgi:release factor glutamine methyltransferase